jgi:hypothetical protein
MIESIVAGIIVLIMSCFMGFAQCPKKPYILFILLSITAFLLYQKVGNIYALWLLVATEIIVVIFKITYIFYKKYIPKNIKHNINIANIRQNEIRRIVRGILTGHSSVIIGLPSTGKTLVLNYLHSEQTKQDYGSDATKQVFVFFDHLRLNSESTQADFWEKVLLDLKDNSILSEYYEKCRDNHFEKSALKELFRKIADDGQQLVLLIDRYEQLLKYPALKNTEFFGTLREFASDFNIPLILVVTMNCTLEDFHRKTETFNNSGSPFLNFMEQNQVFLGALPDEEIENFLNQNHQHLSTEDKQFIKQYAGGHPELLRVAIEVVMDASKKHSVEQLQRALLDRTLNLLEKTLLALAPNVCKAFMAVINDSDKTGFKRELRELEKRGLLIQNDNDEWQVRPQILLKFCRDKTAQEICDRKIV